MPVPLTKVADAFGLELTNLRDDEAKTIVDAIADVEFLRTHSMAFHDLRRAIESMPLLTIKYQNATVHNDLLMRGFITMVYDLDGTTYIGLSAYGRQIWSLIMPNEYPKAEGEPSPVKISEPKAGKFTFPPDTAPVPSTPKPPDEAHVYLPNAAGDLVKAELGMLVEFVTHKRGENNTVRRVGVVAELVPIHSAPAKKYFGLNTRSKGDLKRSMPSLVLRDVKDQRHFWPYPMALRRIVS